MTETAIAPAPETSAAAPASPEPVSTPAAEPTPELTGIAKAMGDFDALTTPKPKEKAAVKADPKPGEAPKTDAAPAKPAKAEKEEVDWETAPPKLKGAFFKHQRESQAKIQDYERRIKEIDAKAKEAPGDAKLVEGYQSRIKQLETDLTQAAYQKSPEFKKQFTDRWQDQYKAAVGDVTQLQITIPGPEGEQAQVRAATQADFDKIRALPPQDQDEAIATLFPKSAGRVYSHLTELKRIERNAQQALQEHSQNLEVATKESELKAQRESQSYEATFSKTNEELAARWPEFFAPDEKDVEATEALQKGYDYVDKVAKTASQMPPEERAAYQAIIRARSAALPRVVLDLKRAKGELESLREELKKFRGGDPGGGTERHDPTAAKGKVGSIDEMSRAFEAVSK